LEELNNQKASHKIEELERAKQHLEQEVYVNKRRLEMETLATKQVSPSLSPHLVRGAAFDERAARSLGGNVSLCCPQAPVLLLLLHQPTARSHIALFLAPF
jgi:hypothetical protein